MSQRVTSISAAGSAPTAVEHGFDEPPLALGGIEFAEVAADLPHAIVVVRFERVVWANERFFWLIGGAASSELRQVAFGDLFKDVKTIKKYLGKSFKRHLKNWKPQAAAFAKGL